MARTPFEKLSDRLGILLETVGDVKLQDQDEEFTVLGTIKSAKTLVDDQVEASKTVPAKEPTKEPDLGTPAKDPAATKEPVADDKAKK